MTGDLSSLLVGLRSFNLIGSWYEDCKVPRLEDGMLYFIKNTGSMDK